MKPFFLAFRFEDLDDPILVKYRAEKDLRYEIEDYIQSLDPDVMEDMEQTGCVRAAMEALHLTWEWVPYSVIAVG